MSKQEYNVTSLGHQIHSLTHTQLKGLIPTCYVGCPNRVGHFTVVIKERHLGQQHMMSSKWYTLEMPYHNIVQ